MQPHFNSIAFSARVCLLAVVLIASSCDEDDLTIQYPETGFYGDNFLEKQRTSYTTENGSLHAGIPKGKKLKVIVTGLTATDISGLWYYAAGSGHNWAISHFDWTTHTQSFTSIDPGLTCELEMYFNEGTFQIDYYEDGSSTPTFTKTIEVK